MLDIGWSEMLVIAVILIVVVGPKDLPPMLRAFGKMTTKLRRTAGEFRAQFDEALREAELEDVGKTISDVRRFNPGSVVRDAMKPLQDAGESLRDDIRAADTKSPPLPEMPSPLPPVNTDLAPQADPAPAKVRTAKPKASKPAAAAPAKVPAKLSATGARKPKVGRPAAAEKTVAAAEPDAVKRKAPARKKAATTAKDKA